MTIGSPLIEPGSVEVSATPLPAPPLWYPHVDVPVLVTILGALGGLVVYFTVASPSTAAPRPAAPVFRSRRRA